MNYKNSKPKKFKGCCSQCACRDHDMGLRNKRALSLQELRVYNSTLLDELTQELDEIKQEFGV